jgi:nitrilase
MTPLRPKPAYKVAAIQASPGEYQTARRQSPSDSGTTFSVAPVYFDLEATLAKAIALTREAASNGATLVVFPELYLPGYPFYIWLDPYGKWTERTEGYYANCPAIDGPERDILVSLARELQITIVMGCGERDHGSLYMAQWIIGPEGLIAQRRKLKPSLMER